MDAAYEKSRRGESMGTIRLDKLLAASGAGTRSEVKNFIRKGRVTVNGTVCKNADSKADAESDVICLDGQPVFYSEFEYHMLYKPDSYCIPNVTLIVFIMSFQFISSFYDFLIKRVFNVVFNCDNDCFVHFIADNLACTNFS